MNWNPFKKKKVKVIKTWEDECKTQEDKCFVLGILELFKSEPENWDSQPSACFCRNFNELEFISFVNKQRNIKISNGNIYVDEFPVIFFTEKSLTRKILEESWFYFIKEPRQKAFEKEIDKKKLEKMREIVNIGCPNFKQ